MREDKVKRYQRLSELRKGLNELWEKVGRLEQLVLEAGGRVGNIKFELQGKYVDHGELSTLMGTGSGLAKKLDTQEQDIAQLRAIVWQASSGRAPVLRESQSQQQAFPLEYSVSDDQAEGEL